MTQDQCCQRDARFGPDHLNQIAKARKLRRPVTSRTTPAVARSRNNAVAVCDAQDGGERLRREHGFAQRGGDGVRQPAAAIAAGGKPGALVGGGL